VKRKKVVGIKILLLSVTIIFSLIAGIQLYSKKEIIDDVLNHELSNLVLAKKTINGLFLPVVKDSLFWGESHIVKLYLLDSGSMAMDDINDHLNRLLVINPSYDQVRILNQQGIEKIKYVRSVEGIKKVPFDKLQNKFKKDYFQGILRKAKGEICISYFNLNKEFSKIEIPFKPAIRFSSPIFNEEKLIGAFIINYLGDKIFQSVSGHGMEFTGELTLLNYNGYRLMAPEKDKLFAFEFPEKEKFTYRIEKPALWKKLTDKEKGTLFLEGNYYVFNTIKRTDFSTCSKPGWKIISTISEDKMGSKLESYYFIFIIFICIKGFNGIFNQIH